MTRSIDLRAWLPLCVLAVVVLIWSGNTVVSKVIMREASPVLVSLVRFTLVGMLFYLPVFLWLHRGSQRFTRAEWPRLITLGVAGTTGSQIFFMMGLQTTPATEAGIYQVLTPIFVVLIAWLWIGERLSRVRIAGIVVAALGATVLLTGGGTVGLGGGDLMGVFLILLSNLCWSFYTVLNKSLLTRRSPLLVLATANIVAMVTTWPVAWLFGALEELPTVLNWSPMAWAVMVYLVALTGTSSQWLYTWTIREIGPSRVSASLYLKPFFVALLAIAFLSETPTLLTLVSGLVILLGVWMVNRPQSARAPSAGKALPRPLTSATR